MRWCFSIVLAAVLPVCAAAEWTEVTSPNFYLITTAGSGEARSTVEFFEQVRDFFMRTRSQQMTTRLPVTIVLFRNMKEFQPYAPNEVAAAYYTGDQSHDYIVMSGSADDDRPVAIHEYMHLLIRNMDLKLPPWLNEGIADVYSSLTPYAGKIAVGMIPNGRAYSLALDKWIPLERVLAVQHDSPEYNEKARAGAFYAQSWMLVHMMNLSDAYRGQFGKFVGLISAGTSSEAAFQQVYGKSVADVNKDLNAYYRSNSLKAVLYDTKLQKFERFQPGPANEFTVELTLARISGLSGRKDESLARLARLAKQYPDKWEAHEALGAVAWRKQDHDLARTSFRRAVDLKPPLWSVYWDYARIAQSDPKERPNVITALQRSLELNGGNLDARLALGYELFEAGRFQESFDTYNVIRSITPDRAPQLFLGKAHAAARLGKFDEAKTAALSASKYAKDGRDVQSASALLEYLERREKVEAQRQQWEAGNQTAPPPQTYAAAPPAGAAHIAPVLSSVTGLLKQVDCMTARARLQLQAEDKTVNLLIANPDTITIRNEPGSSVNLTCGPQSPAVRVTVEYLDKLDQETRTTGEVRTLEFRSK